MSPRQVPHREGAPPKQRCLRCSVARPRPGEKGRTSRNANLDVAVRCTGDCDNGVGESDRCVFELQLSARQLGVSSDDGVASRS